MFKVLKDFERKEDQNNNLIYEQYSLPVSTNKIKCIKYGSNNIVILTKFNEYNAFIEQTFLKEDEKINHVECGDDTIIVVNNYNQFYEATITGLKSCGIFNRLTLLNFPESEAIKFLSCGYKYFFIITKNNDIYGCGRNNEGQLGITGVFSNNYYSRTRHHTIILNEFNDLYGAGYNASGQLGLNDGNERNEFTKIVINNFKKGEIVNCIYKSFHDHTLISTNLNNLYFTGINTGNKFNLGSSGNLDNISNFKKLDYIKMDKQFIYPLLLQNFFFIISNHKFNNEEEELNQIQLNLLKSLQNKNCCDLEFDAKEEKKRKRHDFENQIH
ncbi:hypothetical protein ABK040_014857 [Willaertia magna]